MANKINFIDCFCERNGGESGPPMLFEQPIRSNNFHSTNITHIDRNYKSYPLVIVMIFSQDCMRHSTIASFEGIIYLPSIFLFLAAKEREGHEVTCSALKKMKKIRCLQRVGVDSNRWVSPVGSKRMIHLSLESYPLPLGCNQGAKSVDCRQLALRPGPCSLLPALHLRVPSCIFVAKYLAAVADRLCVLCGKKVLLDKKVK